MHSGHQHASEIHANLAVTQAWPQHVNINITARMISSRQHTAHMRHQLTSAARVYSVATSLLRPPRHVAMRSATPQLSKNVSSRTVGYSALLKPRISLRPCDRVHERQ